MARINIFQDLRVYTIWRSEFSQYKQQALPYKKSATEWEILGDLAQRLHHHEEALEAFNATLKIRFSPRALRGILLDQEKRKDSLAALNSIIKLTAWQYRWYSEVGTHDSVCCIRLSTDTITVLTGAFVLYTKVDCNRRCRQGPQHRAGYQLPAVCSRFDAPLCSIVYGVPQQRERRVDARGFSRGELVQKSSRYTYFWTFCMEEGASDPRGIG